ncbi:hypothetical protein DPEC_G00195410 [Dallia pectoralis]|uniref:Uncharacterized protein n=1 Tax=Dallia pectoralis TaxID=75939 RepID=A0ACC2G711_DALPE|nr:hypothetical protein DPEC_G00195410 [Dallia pectoralis]
MTWTIWKCLQSDTSLTLRRTAFMVMEEAYTELYREFLKLRSLCLKQAALLQQLTETLKRRQGEATFSGELGAMPTNAIQCTQEIPGPVPVRPEPPMVQRNIPAKQPEPPLVQIHNTATQHGVIAQSGAVGLLSGVLRQRLDRVHLDLACDGTEKKDVLKLSPFIPVDKPGGNGETVPFSALGDSKQADRFWGNDETREMFRMPSGFGSFLNSDFLRQTGGMMFMSEVALQSQSSMVVGASWSGTA